LPPLRQRERILRDGGDYRQEQIAKDILNYLLHHPAGADTFDGIARWRVLEEIARRSVASTEDAMQWLIAKGFLCEEKIAGGRTLYRLDAGKKKEAELLVKEKRAKPPRRPRQAAGG
jgi:hypothetical protein